MAFARENPRVPTDIGRFTLHLTIWPDATGKPGEGTFDFEVLDENGVVIKTLADNLVPHTTAAERNQILTFLTNKRTMAYNEVIGP